MEVRAERPVGLSGALGAGGPGLSGRVTGPRLMSRLEKRRIRSFLVTRECATRHGRATRSPSAPWMRSLETPGTVPSPGAGGVCTR